MPRVTPGLVALSEKAKGNAQRSRTRLAHGLRVLSGVDDPQLGPTPRELVWQRGPLRLYRYSTGRATQVEPILIVMSLVTKPTVFDLAPGMSFVEVLLGDGFDVYLLDWGVPGPVEAGNTLYDYTCRFLPQAVEAASRDAGGGSINLLGYCLGGTLTLLTVAAQPQLPVHSVVLVATPIAFAAMGPVATTLANGAVRVEDALDDTGNVPPATVAAVIKLVKPTGDLTTVLSLWDSLPHRQLLAAHRTMMAWAGDHIPFPGAAACEFVELGMRRNAFATGIVPIGDRIVQLTNVRCRVLNVYGTQDALVPPAAHSDLAELLPNAEFSDLPIETGHAGLFVGRKSRTAMAAMAAWLGSTHNASSGVGTGE
jgi:polyhydroxyalkanoate synthase subunit PhaC